MPDYLHSVPPCRMLIGSPPWITSLRSSNWLRLQIAFPNFSGVKLKWKRNATLDWGLRCDWISFFACNRNEKLSLWKTSLQISGILICIHYIWKQTHYSADDQSETDLVFSSFTIFCEYLLECNFLDVSILIWWFGEFAVHRMKIICHTWFCCAERDNCRQSGETFEGRFSQMETLQPPRVAFFFFSFGTF